MVLAPARGPSGATWTGGCRGVGAGRLMKERVVVSWSTGKDSAWCLHRLRQDPEVEVAGLLTTVTPAFGRVSVHGTRIDVLRAQAQALNLPLITADLPYPCPNEAYEEAMTTAIGRVVEAWDVRTLAFGDLFLEDIRAYRETLLEPTSLHPVFPLWGLDTGVLASEMVEAGLQAIVVSAPEDSPAAELVGRPWTPGALSLLEGDVDPCGERGEFHTCVVGGPDMAALDHRVGSVVHRDGAVYADLMLGG